MTLPAPTPLGGADVFAARLGTAMLDAGVARPELYSANWSRKKTPADFIAAAVKEFVEARGGADIQKRFRLEATMSRMGTYRYAEPARENMAMLSVMPAYQSGVVSLGPMIRLLDPINPRLPATVWNALREVCRSVRAFTWEDAMEMRESDLEMFEGDDKEREMYLKEHKPIAVPAALGRRPLSLASFARLAARRGDDRLKTMATACAEIAQVRRSMKGYRSWWEDMQTDHSPLPVLVCQFEARDRIAAAFDEACQWLGQGDEGPNFAWEFDPVADDVADVFDRFALVIRLFAATARLIEAFPAQARYRQSRVSNAFIVNGPQNGTRPFGRAFSRDQSELFTAAGFDRYAVDANNGFNANDDGEDEDDDDDELDTIENRVAIQVGV